MYFFYCVANVFQMFNQEELRFYNNDHTFTTLIVEKNLRTMDLCELLKVRKNAIGAAWSIIEVWPKLGIGMYIIINVTINIIIINVTLSRDIYYLSSG